MTSLSTLHSELSTRLVTLCDGRRGLRGTLTAEIRETPGDKPVLDFIASDETLDRYDEVIVASGWQLENYRRNPVFQNAHQYGDVIFTLGRALVTEVRQAGLAVPGEPRSVLFQRIEFATEVNPMARIAYGLYKGKFLNAVSVGFIPIRWETPAESSSSSIPRRRYLEQELLEVSAVGIPANPNALALGLKAGAVEKQDVRELAELLGQALGNGKNQTEANKENEAKKRSLKRVELLALAKQLRDILRRA